MSDQSTKSINLLRIYDRLRQSPVTLDVLFNWTKRIGINISRRSLYRYLNDLETTVHFKGEKLVVYEGEKNKKVWKIEFDKSSSALNQFDLNTYYFIRDFLPRSISDPRQLSIHKFDKVFYESLSKSKFQLNVDAHNNAFIRTNYIDAIYEEKDHVLLEDFIWAIQNHRKIKIDAVNFDLRYFPDGFKKDVLLCPLKIVYHFGLLYICTYWEDASKMIFLPYNKIVESSITNVEFNPSKYLPILEKYLDDHFGLTANYDDDETLYDIELEVAGFTGEYISTMHWHKSQQFKRLDNGNTIMYLKCGLNRELLGFIVFFMNNVKVLKPKKLQDYLLERLQIMIDNYSTNKLEYVSSLGSIIKEKDS